MCTSAKKKFLTKKGGKDPKIRKKLNQLRFGSNFQGKLKPINDQNFTQPMEKSNFLQKVGLKTLKISKKLNPDSAQIFRLS